MNNGQRILVGILALALLLTPGVGLSQAQGPEPGEISIAGVVASRISYQGELKQDGVPVTGSRDMIFRLYSDSACTTQVGSDIVKNGVPVSDGLFSVKLDVRQGRFNGQALWLEVEVGGTAMDCQEILPAPYALSLRPGATIADGGSLIRLNHEERPGDPPSIWPYKYGIYAEITESYQMGATAVYGRASAGLATTGIYGRSDTPAGRGVFGYASASSGDTYGVGGQSESPDGRGVYGYASATSGTTYGLYGQSESDEGRGVYGTAPNVGVEGHATANSGTTIGVHGLTDSESDGATGVYGQATANSGITYGVYGRTDSRTGGESAWAAAGVFGEATATDDMVYGVKGRSHSPKGAGVLGVNGNEDGGIGVRGLAHGTGVRGISLGINGQGVSGYSYYYQGVYGESEGSGGHGVYGRSSGDGGYGVYGQATDGDGYGVYAENTSDWGTGLYARGGESGYAAIFEGTAQTQVLEITGGSDLAEPFQVAGTESIAPGMVMAIDAEHSGQLRVADSAYDRTVAGCVSGANGINPGLTMGQEGTVANGSLPVALSGRVYCWADAAHGAIRPGDLLTTSDTPGHVMRVNDYNRAQGAIIGKAMSALEEGQDLVLVLVALH